MLALATWLLLNGIDDLLIDFVWFYRMLFRPSKPPIIPDGLPERRMAIFVPLWREHRVIRTMVEHNLAAQQYTNYDFFIGGYPNDAPTLSAIAELAARFPNVHVAECPHPGPTSKADCLNWIYQRMLLFEEQHGVRFEMVLTHDAEDLIHAEALRWINYYAQWNDMVQIPVLALKTPWWELTHGVYCDEFALFQHRDMPSRAMTGGFTPSNGVGTGFSREALERLAAAHANRIFEPACLTEDYENGFRVHRLGCRQIFVPLAKHAGGFVATREYFPRKFKAAVRQRTRWTTGITLQSWEMHGLRDSFAQAYWLWRDRKSLINNLITPFIHLATLTGALPARFAWPLAALSALHLTMRAACSARIYGWRFALATPVRYLWGTWINCLAAIGALWQFTTAKLQHRPLVWLKTEHAYPNRSALMETRRPLEEVLVRSGFLTETALNAALATKPDDTPLPAHLLRLHVMDEQTLYEAISLETSLPLGPPEPGAVSAAVTRSFPAAVINRWRVLPFKVAAGHLHVAAATAPTGEMEAELRTFSSLEIRFQLVTPADFKELTDRYLPELEAA